MDNVSYIITCNHTKQSLLVDAANEADRLLSALPHGTLHAIVTTHRHHDHIQALAAIVEATGATTYAGRADAAAITEATGVPMTIALDDGAVIALGDIAIRVIGLAGHTPGSIALAVEANGETNLMTGDSLFPGGVGATNGDPARFTQLVRDVEDRLFSRFSDAAVVLPGHGNPTTIGAERPALASWRERGW